jgi:hypothetical protein
MNVPLNVLPIMKQPDLLKAVGCSIASIVIHYGWVQRTIKFRNAIVWKAVTRYILGIFWLWGTFLLLAFYFYEARTVVIGIYLGYNLYYILRGAYKSFRF